MTDTFVKREKFEGYLNMYNKNQILLRWFILLFMVSVSVTIIPGNVYLVLGLFGEIKSSTITEDDNFLEESTQQVRTDFHKHKGINIINIWYELLYGIIFMIFIMYKDKLPRGDTVITLKVRMDN